jgi:hypothetical protein
MFVVDPGLFIVAASLFLIRFCSLLRHSCRARFGELHSVPVIRPVVTAPQEQHLLCIMLHNIGKSRRHRDGLAGRSSLSWRE